MNPYAAGAAPVDSSGYVAALLGIHEGLTGTAVHGLGTISTQNANNVSISGGSISGVSGVVSSVAVTGANGIGVSGSPITSSGTIGLSLGAITPTSVTFPVGTTVANGIVWGTDTNLYRSAANILKTDDTFIVAGAGIEIGAPLGARVTLSRDDNIAPAYFSWYNSSNLRLGVLGGASPSYLNFDLENGADLSIEGGNVGIGNTAATAIGNDNKLQVAGTTAATNSLGISAWSADALGSRIELGKSRGAAIGTNTIVQDGDVVGSLLGYGANGSTFINAASISIEIDGTPGASNDMPGRVVIKTTPNGSGTLTEAARFDSAQNTVLIGSIKTAAPTTGTAAAWKLGSNITGQIGLTLDTTKYVELDIGGTFIKVATVT